MSKFKKDGGDKDPAISTSSLPDIVFMLLFFFMVSTVMREVELKVSIDQPEATEIEKLENKALVNYVYIGEPLNAETYGTASRIQLNDAFASVKEVGPYIETRRAEVDEAEVPLLTTSLKVDKETEMGIVTDVKQELRKVQALKISYSTREKMDADKF
ncbi:MULTISPECIES: ExbD/TolR family protein [Salibacter]|jgi:biopolymer transport protein ExbD|uniref:Biopolymer transporter ExbD n=1 Tax=Salibacter halophilus TaxID=1803916 RepID=A0A6N6M4N9_9FLAO|nr:MULTISPECIES: biopolymer transporter ExbD [Salibacter]KAB1063209.1 biopolymer transporter ExbD [Salibacter halophilus]MDR9399183.1 biopolymer transporter ExbD [Salibacter sp.]MDR9487959.1 biopolymer transporter ExbD [Salibacter sp.]